MLSEPRDASHPAAAKATVSLPGTKRTPEGTEQPAGVDHGGKGERAGGGTLAFPSHCPLTPHQASICQAQLEANITWENQPENADTSAKQERGWEQIDGQTGHGQPSKHGGRLKKKSSDATS